MIEEGFQGIDYFLREVVWNDWIVDKFGRQFLKGIVPAWNWLKDNWKVVLDGVSAIASIGGGIASLLCAIGVISIPIAGQVILAIVSIGFGIYGLGRAFGWW